jgi:hypothetical protein
MRPFLSTFFFSILCIYVKISLYTYTLYSIIRVGFRVGIRVGMVQIELIHQEALS